MFWILHHRQQGAGGRQPAVCLVLAPSLLWHLSLRFSFHTATHVIHLNRGKKQAFVCRGWSKQKHLEENIWASHYPSEMNNIHSLENEWCNSLILLFLLLLLFLCWEGRSKCYWASASPHHSGGTSTALCVSWVLFERQPTAQEGNRSVWSIDRRRLIICSARRWSRDILQKAGWGLLPPARSPRHRSLAARRTLRAAVSKRLLFGSLPSHSYIIDQLSGQYKYRVGENMSRLILVDFYLKWKVQLFESWRMVMCDCGLNSLEGQ